MLDDALPGPLVDVRHVRHFYGKGSGSDLLVLDDIDLQLKDNEIVGLLGRSGSGKSTLLRSIAGLLKPSAGEVLFQGSVVEHGVSSQFRRKRRSARA